MLTALRTILISTLAAACMASAATVSGTVHVAGAADPLQGAKVVLILVGNGNNSTRVDSAVTDNKGHYAFDSVKTTGFYEVQASLAGYQNGTNFGSVNRPNADVKLDIAMTKTGGGGGGTGTVLGIVHDASTLAAINGASVVLAHRSGGGSVTVLDTVKTGSDGRFAFDSVPAQANYVVTVMASGYVTQSNNSLDVTAKDTTRVQFNMVKQPSPSAKIIGKVVEGDSNKAVTGAKVVLRVRAGSGFPVVWESLGSATTGADGAYSFDSLPAAATGSPYDIVVSKADYETVTSQNIPLGQNQTETVNVKINKIAKGSMAIFVGQDTTARPPLVGAAVSAVLQGGDSVEYSGVTDSKGWVSFPTVIAGSYVVTASLNGFVTKIQPRTVQADEKDTGLVYLARATAANSKSLSGIIRDATGKAVAGADVVFEANAGGGNHILVHATASATGDYSFDGIPMAVNGGTVTVQADGFADFSGNIALSAAANFLNVTLQKAVSVRAARSQMESPRLLLGANGSALLRFPSATAAGRLLVYDARGTLLMEMPVASGASSVSLPERLGFGRAARFAVWEQGGVALRLMPSLR